LSCNKLGMNPESVPSLEYFYIKQCLHLGSGFPPCMCSDRNIRQVYRLKCQIRLNDLYQKTLVTFCIWAIYLLQQYRQSSKLQSSKFTKNSSASKGCIMKYFSQWVRGLNLNLACTRFRPHQIKKKNTQYITNLVL